MMDWESGQTGIAAIAAAGTPPVLGLTPIPLVKYQQRHAGKFARSKVKRGGRVALIVGNPATACTTAGFPHEKSPVVEFCFGGQHH